MCLEAFQCQRSQIGWQASPCRTGGWCRPRECLAWHSRLPRTWCQSHCNLLSAKVSQGVTLYYLHVLPPYWSGCVNSGPPLSPCRWQSDHYIQPSSYIRYKCLCPEQQRRSSLRLSGSLPSKIYNQTPQCKVRVRSPALTCTYPRTRGPTGPPGGRWRWRWRWARSCPSRWPRCLSSSCSPCCTRASRPARWGRASRGTSPPLPGWTSAQPRRYCTWHQPSGGSHTEIWYHFWSLTSYDGCMTAPCIGMTYSALSSGLGRLK